MVGNRAIGEDAGQFFARRNLIGRGYRIFEIDDDGVAGQR